MHQTIQALASSITLATACQIIGTGAPVRRSLPCPVCKAPSRSNNTRDRRLPIGYRGDRWKCHRCQDGGDAIDFLAWHWIGVTYAAATPDQRATVRGLLRDAGLLAPPDRQPRAAQHRAAQHRAHLAAVPSPADVPSYPPADELAAVWSAAVPITGDRQAAEYLQSRLKHPAAVKLIAARDLCRVLPCTADVPRWARFAGKPWPDSHRLIFPGHDHRGVLRTLTARRMAPADTPKSLPPVGFDRRGTLIGCDRMRAMLADPRSATVPDGMVLRVWLVEGEMDAAAALLHRGRLRVAGGRRRRLGESIIIAGLQPGGWTKHHADRLPTGCMVVLHPDDDPGGENIGAGVVRCSKHRRDISILWGAP